MTVPLDLDAYLDRIGLAGPIGNDAAGLTRLHEAHVGAIPFENLDIALGRLPIRLDLHSLQAKLVTARRGGYCFEQNLLFKAVLDRLGFKTTMLASRVRIGGLSRPTPRTHILLKVETRDGAYLADVGFGGAGLLRPIALLPDIVFHVPDAAYRLRHETGCWVLEGDVGAETFSDLYSFTMEPQLDCDVEVANHFISTHPSSIFRRVLTVQRILPDRRLVLRDFVLTVQRGDETEETRLGSEAERLEILARLFGIDLPANSQFSLPEAQDSALSCCPD